MALTNRDVVEGYFADADYRLARAAAAQRDQAHVSYPEVEQSQVAYTELAQGAGQLALGETVQIQL